MSVGQQEDPGADSYDWLTVMDGPAVSGRGRIWLGRYNEVWQQRDGDDVVICAKPVGYIPLPRPMTEVEIDDWLDSDGDERILETFAGTFEVDDRTVFLSPAAGPWYSSDPGRWHTSRTCAGRGMRRYTTYDGRKGPEDLARVREVFLEKAVKEGFRPCGICAQDVQHGFVPADYPPGTLDAFLEEVTA